MNSITVTDTELIIEPQGMDKLWGLHRQIRVPLSHVRGATLDAGVAAEPRGLRGPGLAVPGKYVGTFHRDGEASFWNVSDPRANIVIQLADEQYVRAVLTVTDPAAAERTINTAITHLGAAGHTTSNPGD